MPSARSARRMFSFARSPVEQRVGAAGPGALDLDVALGVAHPVAVRVAQDRDQVLRVRALAVLLVGERELARRGALVYVLAARRARGRGSASRGTTPGITRMRVLLPEAFTAAWIVLYAQSFSSCLWRFFTSPLNDLMRSFVLACADDLRRAGGAVHGEAPWFGVGEERGALRVRARGRGQCNQRSRDKQHRGHDSANRENRSKPHHDPQALPCATPQSPRDPNGAAGRCHTRRFARCRGLGYGSGAPSTGVCSRVRGRNGSTRSSRDFSSQLPPFSSRRSRLRPKPRSSPTRRTTTRAFAASCRRAPTAPSTRPSSRSSSSPARIPRTRATSSRCTRTWSTPLPG